MLLQTTVKKQLKSSADKYINWIGGHLLPRCTYAAPVEKHNATVRYLCPAARLSGGRDWISCRGTIGGGARRRGEDGGVAEDLVVFFDENTRADGWGARRWGESAAASELRCPQRQRRALIDIRGGCVGKKCSL